MVWSELRRSFSVLWLACMIVVCNTNQGSAFGGNNIPFTNIATPNGGPASVFNDIGSSTAFISLGIPGSFPGGAVYSGNAIITGSAVSVADLLSLGYLDATIISQNGADSTYATDGYIGIVFTARETAGGPLFRYEIALSGVAFTQFIETRTPVSSPQSPTEQTQRLIQAFQNARANSLVTNQPNLTKFMLQTGAASFDASVSRGAGYLNFASDPSLPVWFNLTGNRSSQGDFDSSYALAVVGAHRRFSQNLLVGAMLQLDYAETDEGAAEIDGTGWLVGPYVVAKLPSQPIFFEGRALYGKASNDVSPLGTYEDSFDSDRWLIQSRVTGQVQRGSLTLMPLLDVSYVTDDQEAYTDSLGNRISAQDFSLTTARLGLDFSQPLAVSRGQLTLTGGLSGVWSSTSGTGTAPGLSPIGDTTRGRADLGLDYRFENNSLLEAGMFYDGFGESDFESYSLNLIWRAEF